jgi:hypothetical protein
VFATGGAGLSSLSGLANGLGGQDDPMQSLATGLASFLDKFSKENAAIYSFRVASMSQFGWDEKAIDPWTDLKESQLRQIAETYNETVTEIANAQDYLAHGIWYKALGKGIEDTTQEVLPRLKQYQLDLALAHKKCKAMVEVGSCDIPVPMHVLMPLFLPPPAPTVSFKITPHPALPPPTGNPPVYTSTEEYWSTYRPIQGDRAKAILSAKTDDQVRVAKTFEPSADNFSAEMDLEGDFLDTTQYLFVLEDGTELKATFLASSSVTGGTWAKIPRELVIDDVSKFFPEEVLIHWLGQFQQEQSGTFYLQVKDRLGRTFRMPLCDVISTAMGGSVTSIRFSYQY